MNLPSPCLTRALALLSVFAVSSAAWADEHATILRYVADDVAAVFFLDLNEVDIPAASAQFAKLLPGGSKQVEDAAEALQERINQFRDLGIGRVYALLRISDIAQGGPMWVLPIAGGDQLSLVRKRLEELLSTDGLWPDMPLPSAFATVDGYILAASNAAQLAALEKGQRDAGDVRSDVKQAFDTLAGHDAMVMVFGDTDSRRVVRELFPQLPTPFDEVDGDLIADGIQWIGVAINLPPDPNIEMHIEANDHKRATQLKRLLDQLIVSGRAFVQQQLQNKRPEVTADLGKGFDMLQPHVVGSRVSLALGDHPEAVAALTDLLTRPIQAAQRAAWRNARINRFRQIALAMLNYVSANKSLPPRAITDKSGRPLLSWRVAVLPYLELSDLYEQFHLDEPWDSEHNRKLIEQMPEVYADPNPAIVDDTGSGRTTFQVPMGERTIFPGVTAMKLKEISDGTSNTVLVVEVVPERAAVWTKPDDWVVDFGQPFAGVSRGDGGPFTAVFCDGHVRMISPNDPRDAGNWPKLLTPAGGEEIEP